MSKEKNRFEKLMEYFINDDSNIDFMVGQETYQLLRVADCFTNKGTFQIHLRFDCQSLCRWLACSS